MDSELVSQRHGVGLEDKRPFIYKAPDRGQPRGVMPLGWIDTVQALLEKEERDKQVRLANEAAQMAKELEDEERAAKKRAGRDRRARELLREDEDGGGGDSRARSGNSETKAPEEKEGEHRLGGSTRSIEGGLG